MKKRIVITAIILAVIHFVLTIGSVVIAFGAGMEAFDNPGYQPSGLERIADGLAEILMQPGMSLWTPWMSKNMPNIVEWAFCVVNSLLWGFAIALIVNARVLVKGKKLYNNKAYSISESRANASSRNK